MSGAQDRKIKSDKDNENSTKTVSFFELATADRAIPTTVTAYK